MHRFITTVFSEREREEKELETVRSKDYIDECLNSIQKEMSVLPNAITLFFNPKIRGIFPNLE